ncbi:MAG: AsmA-like C-terminal region-containing protein [Polaromonas sp.]|nr:AsmA-like C-terminal region-containing protein [Polaromonas sp.]
MKKRKWFLGAGILLALLGVAWIALLVWLPTDEELAVKAGAELENRLGVPVKIGALHWSLFPTPAVVVTDAVTEQPQPITIRRLTLHPDVPALMDGRFRMQRAELEGAVVPQLSLRALDKGSAETTQRNPDATPLERFVFRDVTWITRRGIPVIYDGDIDFDPNWRPRRAELRRPDFKPATDLVLTRQGEEDRWDVRIRVGGGTGDGEVQLQTRENGRMHLEGQLKPKAVEVSNALAAFNRKSVVAGEASGDTALSADGDTVGELAQSLHTRTVFSMGRSTLLRFDLEKAVRSFGKEHAGQTPLDAITGQLDTQNTPQGMVVTYTGLKASSGALTASGDVKIANRRIDAEFAVDLVDGIVGVPLKVTGPLEKVEVSAPKGAVAGAVLGTAVLPGVGTAIGARLGATLGKIFSPDPAPGKGAAAPPTPKPATR